MAVLAPSRPADDYGLRRYQRAGLFLLAGLVLVILVWGGIAQIAGAVIAPGRVVVESSAKQVQHREGGIISELLVKEGDTVTAGQVLVKLESNVSAAGANMANDQVMELTARQMRLEAERDRRSHVAAPPGSSPTFIAILSAEQRLMATRATEQAQRKAQVAEQVTQLQQQIKGDEAQAAAVQAQIDLMKGELGNIRDLHEQGHASLAYLNNLERQDRNLVGEKERLAAEMSQIRARISEIRLRGVEMDSEFQSNVMNDLKDTKLRLAQVQQQKITEDDVLRRDEIRAPASGKIQQMIVHTQGGVIGPGQVIMLVVPQKDSLVVEAHVDPQHVDQVRVGEKAVIRFTSFQSNITPEVTGKVSRVAADATTDEKTGQSFYIVRCEFSGGKLPKSLSTGLIPGMPAEVHIQTGSRAALSYFLKPLTDQMARTFREE